MGIDVLINPEKFEQEFIALSRLEELNLHDLNRERVARMIADHILPCYKYRGEAYLNLQDLKSLRENEGQTSAAHELTIICRGIGGSGEVHTVPAKRLLLIGTKNTAPVADAVEG